MDGALLGWRRRLPTAAGPEHPGNAPGPERNRRPGRSPAAGCVLRRPRGNAWCWAHGRGYAAAVAQRKRRGCRPVPDPGVLLAQLRSPDEQVRVKALHRVCPCGAGFVVYERFRSELKRLQKDPSPRVRAAALHAEQDACLIEELDAGLDRAEEQGWRYADADWVRAKRRRQATRYWRPL